MSIASHLKVYRPDFAEGSERPPKFCKEMANIALASLWKSFLLPAVGLGLGMLIGYLIMAFYERPLYAIMGKPLTYLAVWGPLYIIPGGVSLGLVIFRQKSLWHFLWVYFLLSMIVMICFLGLFLTVGGRIGAYTGGTLGAAGMGAGLAFVLDRRQAMWKLAGIVGGGNLVGDALGHEVFRLGLGGQTGFLLWGLCFGLVMGGSLGLAAYVGQAGLRAMIQQARQGLLEMGSEAEGNVI